MADNRVRPYEAEPVIRIGTRLGRGLRRAILRAGPGVILSILLLSLMVVAAIGAPLLAPHDPTAGDVTRRLMPPFWLEGGDLEYPLGTDQIGRDVFSRVIYGSRISLTVGVTAVLISGALGTFLGLVSGYRGGLVDAVIMRIADIQLAFPFILLAISVVAVIGSGLLNVVVVLGVAGWVSYGRVVRGQVLSVKEKEFVEAARALGAGTARILFVHILPNVFTPVIVLATFSAASYMVTEAALTFLGLGVPPSIPSWGNMLTDARDYVRTAWWMPVFPGAALALTVLATNLLGDWLRDYLDPHLRKLM